MAICTHAGGRDSSGSVNRNSKTLAKLERVEAAASLPPAVTCVRDNTIICSQDAVDGAQSFRIDSAKSMT
ncbi:hypothetical protein E4U25_003259, partial [Claviceps purpurea]